MCIERMCIHKIFSNYMNHISFWKLCILVRKYLYSQRKLIFALGLFIKSCKRHIYFVLVWELGDGCFWWCVHWTGHAHFSSILQNSHGCLLSSKCCFAYTGVDKASQHKAWTHTIRTPYIIIIAFLSTCFVGRLDLQPELHSSRSIPQGTNKNSVRP